MVAGKRKTCDVTVMCVLDCSLRNGGIVKIDINRGGDIEKANSRF